MPFKSPSIVLETLCAILLNHEPIEVAVDEGPDEVVAVGIRLWPSVEVLSCKQRCQCRFMCRNREPYSYNVVVFHEARLVTREQAEHGEHEGHNCASQREESC